MAERRRRNNKLVLHETPDYQQYALCKGATRLFYPENSSGDVQRAKDICGVCPVQEPCLEEALANEEKYGVWGGTSERERRRLRRQMRLKQAS